jgi:hypothetical protein
MENFDKMFEHITNRADPYYELIVLKNVTEVREIVDRIE